jgi:hypothetical protein
MVNVGDPQETNGWLFQYRRCPRCGFTVRRILREVPDEALLAELRHLLAHAFVHETGDGGRRDSVGQVRVRQGRSFRWGACTHPATPGGEHGDA